MIYRWRGRTLQPDTDPNYRKTSLNDGSRSAPFFSRVFSDSRKWHTFRLVASGERRNLATTETSENGDIPGKAVCWRVKTQKNRTERSAKVVALAVRAADHPAVNSNTTNNRLSKFFIDDLGANPDATVANADVRVLTSYELANLGMALSAEAALDCPLSTGSSHGVKT